MNDFFEELEEYVRNIKPLNKQEEKYKNFLIGFTQGKHAAYKSEINKARISEPLPNLNEIFNTAQEYNNLTILERVYLRRLIAKVDVSNLKEHEYVKYSKDLYKNLHYSNYSKKQFKTIQDLSSSIYKLQVSLNNYLVHKAYSEDTDFGFCEEDEEGKQISNEQHRSAELSYNDKVDI